MSTYRNRLQLIQTVTAHHHKYCGSIPIPLPPAYTPPQNPITIYSLTYSTGYNIKGYPRAQYNSLLLFATVANGSSSIAACHCNNNSLFMRDRSMTNSLHLPLLDTQICSTLYTSYYISIPKL